MIVCDIDDDQALFRTEMKQECWKDDMLGGPEMSFFVLSTAPTSYKKAT